MLPFFTTSAQRCASLATSAPKAAGVETAGTMPCDSKDLATSGCLRTLLPRIQKLDRGNNATFLFGPNATLLFSRYRDILNNVSLVEFERHNAAYVKQKSLEKA